MPCVCVCVSVPINRMGQAGAGSVSLGQRVARIGTPSTLPVHHLSQQVGGVGYRATVAGTGRDMAGPLSCLGAY